ncbi:hypothetical protein LVD15_22850 [Fulvivirga maritima]|uniref:hypothetical protein n=1 Tax=Fulvivirga maritima TaxID=2904247 RepID=UPI001F32B76E|nr:hypothetical protein [Fulvivirga maritima]UII26113.1 hypothetical protein LVD15_22850 [Fulvivirga maritima]
MELWNFENIVTRSESSNLILTTHRIRYQYRKKITSLMLDQISGIEVGYKSKPFYLLIAILCGGAGGIAAMGQYADASIPLFFVALLTLVIYLNSRKHSITVSSASTKIIFFTSGINQEGIRHIVNQIEHTRAKLIKAL